VPGCIRERLGYPRLEPGIALPVTTLVILPQPPVMPRVPFGHQGPPGPAADLLVRRAKPTRGLGPTVPDEPENG